MIKWKQRSIYYEKIFPNLVPRKQRKFQLTKRFMIAAILCYNGKLKMKKIQNQLITLQEKCFTCDIHRRNSICLTQRLSINETVTRHSYQPYFKNYHSWKKFKLTQELHIISFQHILAKFTYVTPVGYFAFSLQKRVFDKRKPTPIDWLWK